MLKEFRELKCGDLFIVRGDTGRNIWCKTPMADMDAYQNQQTPDGAFCTAVCVKGDNKNSYMQCNPSTVCYVPDEGSPCLLDENIQVKTKQGTMEVAFMPEEEYMTIALLYKGQQNGNPGALMVCKKRYWGSHIKCLSQGAARRRPNKVFYEWKGVKQWHKC